MARKLWKKCMLCLLAAALLTAVLFCAIGSRALLTETRRHCEDLIAFLRVRPVAISDAPLLLPPESRLLHLDARGTALADSAPERPLPQLLLQANQLRLSGETVFQAEQDGLLRWQMVGLQPLAGGEMLCLSLPMDAPLAFFFRGFWIWLLLLLVTGGLAYFWVERATQRLVRSLEKVDLVHPNTEELLPELRPMLRRVIAQKREGQKKQSRQLEEMRQAFQRQDQSRRDFTANVSHELKTPLTSISGYAELLQAGVVAPEDIPRFAGRIWEESQRLINLVGDILKLSRLDERPQLSLPWKEVSLLPLCAKVQEQLTPTAEAAGVTLHLTGEDCRVWGTESILTELVYNLTDNAIKYNHSGGRVQLSLSPAEKQVCLTVQDTGIGIPREEQSRVFERFYRVDKSHSREIGGTGLGLSIVKHAAAYHRGRIELESRPGEGACFRVYLPRGEGPTAPLRAKEPDEAALPSADEENAP